MLLLLLLPLLSLSGFLTEDEDNDSADDLWLLRPDELPALSCRFNVVGAGSADVEVPDPLGGLNSTSAANREREREKKMDKDKQNYHRKDPR